MRDAQRQRQHNAEVEAEARLLREERRGQPDGRAVPPRNPRLADEDIQPLLDAACAQLEIAPVRAVLIPHASNATLRKDDDELKMMLPPWARCPLVIYHELAHHPELTHPLFPSHGAEYCATQLRLYELFMPDPVATYFREAFDDNDVRYEPSPKQALRFLSYAMRKGGGEVEVITREPRQIIGKLVEYNRRAGTCMIETPRVHDGLYFEQVTLESLRYASWA